MGLNISGESIWDAEIASPSISEKAMFANAAFRFEAFDEPWKVIYNTPGEAWEDKWGLMYVNRTLKEGVKIPDCGGQVAKLP